MEKQKTILVVEDEKSIREIFVDELENQGFSVLRASNGKEGLEIAFLKKPDLILLDLLMPEMDGMTALKKIREDAWGVNVPVIILTNLSANNEQIVEDVVTHKPIFYLIKSDWKIKDVMEKIEKALKT